MTIFVIKRLIANRNKRLQPKINETLGPMVKVRAFTPQGVAFTNKLRPDTCYSPSGIGFYLRRANPS
jgi:hypothetical protein